MRDALYGCLEDTLRAIKGGLNVVAAGPNFLAVLMMATDSPVITTLPTGIAEFYAPRFDLAVSPVPLPFHANPISMTWHVRSDEEPGNAWLREMIGSSRFASRPMHREAANRAAA